MKDKRRHLTRPQAFAVYEWAKKAVEGGLFANVGCQRAATEASKTLGFLVSEHVFYNIAKDGGALEHFRAPRGGSSGNHSRRLYNFMHETTAAIDEIARSLGTLASPLLAERVDRLKNIVEAGQADEEEEASQ
jgi:hypothetical protein